MNPLKEQHQPVDISLIFRRLEVATPIQLTSFFAELYEAKGFDAYETLKEIVNYFPTIESLGRGHRLIRFLFDTAKGLLIRLTRQQRDELLAWCETQYNIIGNPREGYLYVELAKSVHEINGKVTQKIIAGKDEVDAAEFTPKAVAVKNLLSAIFSKAVTSESLEKLFLYINSLNGGMPMKNVDVLLSALEQADGMNPSNLAIRYIKTSVESNILKLKLEQNIAIRERIVSYLENHLEVSGELVPSRYKREIFEDLLKSLDEALNSQQDTKALEVLKSEQSPRAVPPMAPPPSFPKVSPFTNKMPAPPAIPPRPTTPTPNPDKN